MNRALFLLGMVLMVLGGSVDSAPAAVSLEWHPAYLVVRVGDPVNLGLYAKSDSGSDWPISAMDVIAFHDPACLRFHNLTSEKAPYNWFLDGFFSPSPDNLNDDLGDGQMLYTAWAQLGIPAMATPKGLLVTTFQFSAETETRRTYVTIPATYGSLARTRVFDGTIPNFDVTGRLGSAGIMIVPTGFLTSVAQAKALGDESVFDLAGPIVTRAFGSYFYLEDYDRTAGIRVNCDPSQLPAEGTTPAVSGIIRTIHGERVIDEAVISSGMPLDIPGPIAMNLRAVRTGLNPQGLLIRVAGRVTSVSEGDQTFTLRDGAELVLRVELHGVSAPADGSFAAVTGALGADDSGPLLRVNRALDIRTYP